MEIKFTFEDGSETLAHYGVKGMKWKKHLKATDPDYLAQLGLNAQGFAQNMLGKANEGKEQAAKKLNEFLFRAQAELRYKKNPGHKWSSGNDINSDGTGARSYKETMKNGRVRSWHEYTANNGKSFQKDSYWLNKLTKDRSTRPLVKDHQERPRANKVTKDSSLQSVVRDVLRNNSATYRAKEEFSKINAENASKKARIDSKKAKPVTYKNVVQTVNTSKGGVNETSKDVAKLVYNATLKKPVKKAKADAVSTYKKYQTITKQSNSMSESERNALRDRQRKANNAKKREDANRIRRFLGLPEK